MLSACRRLVVLSTAGRDRCTCKLPRKAGPVAHASLGELLAVAGELLLAKGVAGWPGVHGWMGGRIRQACPRLRLGHTGEPGRSARAAGPPSAAEGTSRQQPVLPSTASAPPRKAAASARTGFHTRLRRWLLPRNCDAKSSGVPPVLRRARCPRRAMTPTSAPSVGSGSVAAVGLCCL